MNRRRFFIGSLAGLGTASLLKGSEHFKSGDTEKQLFDIAPFSRRCSAADRHSSPLTFDYGSAPPSSMSTEKMESGRYAYGMQWAEERDVRDIRVHFRPDSGPIECNVEYWSGVWPFPPPRMPLTLGRTEDPWQGEWLNAAVREIWSGDERRYTFRPLSPSENPRARNLPGVEYRRTLKLRLIFASKPSLEQVQVFTGSGLRRVSARIELGAGEPAPYMWSGALTIYNGVLNEVKLWNGAQGDSADISHFRVTTEGAAKGLLVDLVAAQPSLPGSEDVTIVTINAGDRTFSFAVPDLDKGPIYVPAFHVYVSSASDPLHFTSSVVRSGAKIRQRINKEPEQTYEQATKQIPPLDPADTDGHHKLYLPLAVDASWQKFAFEWGGHVYISKNSAKVMGAERKRLEWNGDRISWRIGTGVKPSFRAGPLDCDLRMLNNDLPVAIATWTKDSIQYTEEAFATLLYGPLSPDDPRRSEQTPAVLMLRLSAHNPSSQAAVAHVWLATEPRERVQYANGMLTAKEGKLIRAHVKLADSSRATPASVPNGEANLSGIQLRVSLSAGEQRHIFISIPFVPRLSQEERHQIATLEYDRERSRVIEYWRQVVARGAVFEVPEERFTKIVRAFAPRLLLSNVKDPKTGLFMVPAATYDYGVYANVGSLQCITLNLLGHQHLAATCLETFVRLQGSLPMAGTYTGDQRWVYHGARVDEDYNYTTGPYGLDHGACLQALAEQYFLTRDAEWLRRNLPSMMHAADWIVEQRRLTQVLDRGEKVPEYGLLPAGRLEDNEDWGHWVGINAECVAGMARLAEAMADIGVPEAGRYAKEAAAYKEDVRSAVLRAARMAAVIRLRDNTYVPYVPTRVHERIRQFGPITTGYYSRYPERLVPLYYFAAVREVFAGPILLLLRDVFHCDEPIADWILDDWEDNGTMSEPLGLNVHGWVDEECWFSRGGMVFEPMRHPVPVYLQKGEVPAALRSLYNGFVATYYPGPNVLTEWYNQWGHGAGPLYKTADEARFVNRLRSMLVREEGDTLWLAAGVPRRWLAPGLKIQVRNAPTYFGPVSYRIESSASEAEIQIELPTRNQIKTAWLVLRSPVGHRILAVEANGKPWRQFEVSNERIRLPLISEPLKISVHF